MILANCTDGLILVVREGQTGKRDLAMCLERLSSGRAKLMGFIFNGQRHRGGSYGYGYRGYGYRRDGNRSHDNHSRSCRRGDVVR